LDYAGIGKRGAAAFIDGLIVTIGSAVIGFLLGMILVAGGTSDPQVLETIGNIVGFFLGWFYYAAMESSPKQATLGKLALSMKVTSLQGERISFGKATGRYFGKILSALILLIGFLMIAFTEKKQGLHDMLAGTLVANK